MKVLLFTHISDIDGLGNVVLARLAFSYVDYVLCETFDLQEKIKTYLIDESIYQYDRIYITDLWLEDPTLTMIAHDEKLKGKIFIFDHHESFLEYENKFDFAHIVIQDENGMCSGTSLFYHHLKQEGYFSSQRKNIEDFAELTRKYDTWEWKNKYHEEMPHELSLLFDAVGVQGYINLMYEKLCHHENQAFYFSDLEKTLIQNQIQKISNKVQIYINRIYIKKVCGKQAGIVFIDYDYRNDLAQYLRDQNYPIDFLMMVVMEKETISYRSIKDDVNVREIAEYYGGKGHDQAASSKINDTQLKQIIESLS